MNAPTERKVWELLERIYSFDLEGRDPVFEYWWDLEEDTVTWKDYTRRVGPSIERWIYEYNRFHNLYTATLTLINSEKFEIKLEWNGDIMPKVSGSWIDEEFLPNGKSYLGNAGENHSESY